jgi:hypothetical protein
VVHKSPDLEEIAAEIGTHRQLLGLVHERVAVAVLEKLGIRADVARAATGRPAGRPATAGSRPSRRHGASKALGQNA